MMLLVGSVALLVWNCIRRFDFTWCHYTVLSAVIQTQEMVRYYGSSTNFSRRHADLAFFTADSSAQVPSEDGNGNGKRRASCPRGLSTEVRGETRARKGEEAG